MTDYWTTIELRLHEESGLHDPNNKMAQILESYFNALLNGFEEENDAIIDEGFLLTSTGSTLDIRGEEMGMPRETGKTASGGIIVAFTENATDINGNVISSYTDMENYDNLFEHHMKIKDEDIESSTSGGLYELLNQYLYELNRNRLDNELPALKFRKPTSDYTVYKGTSLISKTGYEYVLLEDITLRGPTDDEPAELAAAGSVKAVDDGERFNTDANTLSLDENDTSVSQNLFITNPSPIIGGEDGETDKDYRIRLINADSILVNVEYIKKMGVILYAKNHVEDSIRDKMTSFNPYISNKYCAIPPNQSSIQNYLNNELIINKNVKVYRKGWK